MFEYIGNNIGEIASLLGVLAAILAAIFWSHRKLHGDLMEMKLNINNANSRIDNLYNVMMTFLMKEKR